MMMFETFLPCTPGSCKMNGFLAIEQNESIEQNEPLDS